jgi:hypothetical protein
MPGEIRIYFEGDKSLKPGFDAFFRQIGERADARQCKLRIVATGGTPERDFGIAMRKHPAAWNILLRDSEGPLDPSRPPPKADSIFWMVEMMESWFHADKGALAAYYKRHPKGCVKAQSECRRDFQAGPDRRLEFRHQRHHQGQISQDQTRACLAGVDRTRAGAEGRSQLRETI